VARIAEPAVAELQHLGKVVAGVDMEHRKRQRLDPAHPKSLLGQAQEHDRVLAAAEQEHGALELGDHLAQDVDGLGLQQAQVVEPRQFGGGRCHQVVPRSDTRLIGMSQGYPIYIRSIDLVPGVMVAGGRSSRPARG
jgi:hypothetical protein